MCICGHERDQDGFPRFHRPGYGTGMQMPGGGGKPGTDPLPGGTAARGHDRVPGKERPGRAGPFIGGQIWLAGQKDGVHRRHRNQGKDYHHLHDQGDFRGCGEEGGAYRDGGSRHRGYHLSYGEHDAGVL